MNNLIKIENQEIQVKEYQGHRVVTFKDIDLVHERPETTAKQSFNRNRKHFLDGVDFFVVKSSDFQKYEKHTLGFEIPNRGLTLITESGYLMLVKSFTDDLAWKVQRQLVNCYFKVKEEIGKQETISNDAEEPLTQREWVQLANNIAKAPKGREQMLLVVLKHISPYFENMEFTHTSNNGGNTGIKVINDSEDFLNKFRTLLCENNLSISQFSRRSNLAKSNVSNYFNGVHTPSRVNLQLIADTLNVNIEYFLNK